MGLAPYGAQTPSCVVSSTTSSKLTPEGLSSRLECIFYGRRSYGRFFGDHMVDRIGPPRAPDEEITQHHRDFAYAVQQRLQAAALHLAGIALRATGSRNLCIAGGVALNCKMTGALHQSGIANRLFVQPLSYDAGGAMGAAMLAATQAGDDTGSSWTMSDAVECDDAAIEAVLRRNGLRYAVVPTSPTRPPR